MFHSSLSIKKILDLYGCSFILLYSHLRHLQNLFQYLIHLPIQINTQPFQKEFLIYVIEDSCKIQMLPEANVFAVLLLSLFSVHL